MADFSCDILHKWINVFNCNFPINAYGYQTNRPTCSQIPFNPGRDMTLKIGSLPAAEGERALIRQVYSNLLSNAVKFTPARDRAEIEAGSYDQNSETVYYVRDHGIGFDMRFYEKLFGVFQRLHSDEEYKGVGIGLSFVKRIITRHGGRVWAESKVGEGATFYFSLPKIFLVPADHS